MSTRGRAAAAACGLAITAVTLALAGGTDPAQARPLLPGLTASARQVGKLPVSLVITSVSPSYAQPKEKVLVSGLVTNNSGAAISGLQIRLRSAGSPFTSRDELEEYVAGLLSYDSYEPGAVSRPISLRSRATARWSVRLPVRETGMSAFGVYPLAAEADNSGGVPFSGATSRTFLPFWPGKHGQPRPQRQQIAWLFPLIGQPVQGPCPGPVLLNNSLAASVAPGGRLSSLLAAGQNASARTHLTWVIDPSLLASVQKMTGPYQVGGSASCQGNASRPADRAAAAWLTGLRHALAGQNVVVTPYADVDLAALTRDSLDDDLATAFTQGRLVGGQILGRDFAPVRDAALAGRGEPASERASRALNGIAWPADGLANRAVLEDLAVNRITAVVLDSTAARSLSGGFAADTAVASTLDEVNGPMRVLLADDTITQLLASANSPRAAPGTAFAVRQRFLAETAMIAAQAPNSARSIVVAPPRRWDPPPHLAAGLLAETASAPWLKPVSLGALATDSQPPGPQIQLPTGAVKDELSGRLLRQLRSLGRRAELLESIRATPDPTLSQAVAAVESSAWRGRGPSGQAQAMLNRVSAYISGQEQGLTITKPVPVTMGGLKGSPPVSISSHLGYPVRVRLAVRAPGDLKITVAPRGPITIPPGSVVNVKLNVHAQEVGSRTLQLSLVSPAGRALPGTTVTMTIRATQFGTLALIILAAALGVFMITSAARAIRQGGGAPGKAGSPGPAGSPAAAASGRAVPSGQDPDGAGSKPDGRAGDTVEPDGPAQHSGPQTGHHASDAIVRAGTVSEGTVSDASVSDTAVSDTAAGDTVTSAGRDPTEGTDELARAPGQADRA